MTLGVLVNWLAAALLAFTIFFYVVVYTMWLKRWTPQNIVIGGAAGAIPPVIGWAAATGTVSLESVILFLIIFLWTPPHFWALALFKSDEYAPCRHPDDAERRGRCRRHAARSSPIRCCSRRSACCPGCSAMPRMGYGVVAGGARRRLRLVRLEACSGCRDDDRVMSPAKALFGYSLLYLFAHLRRLSRRPGRRRAGRPWWEHERVR